MSTMSSNKKQLLDPGLCRCCKSIKKCRILTADYEWMGTKEVYSDMLMDCFGLLLSYLDGDVSERGVCATCVVRLRDACAFRKQVLQCEQTFLQIKLTHADESNKTEDIGVKTEPIDECDRDDAASMPDTCSEDDMPIKNLKTQSVKMKTRKEVKSVIKTKIKCEASKLKNKIVKKKLCKKRTGAKSSKIVKEDINNIRENLKLSALSSGLRKKPLLKRPQIDIKDYSSGSDERFLAEDNTITIVENSFIYPFTNRSNNFYCFYCKEYCAKPEDLSIHTHNHDPKVFKNIMSSKKFHYMEVSRIDCRLCSERIDDLETFKKHITEKHGKKLHKNVTDRFIQFRLTFTDLVCCVCSKVFFDFNAIEKHMVEHYSNFTCDICGLCFLEEYRLSIHMRCHKAEEKHPCEVCGKIFKSKCYKDSHVDTIHNKIPTIRCTKCDDMFLSYSQRNKHLVEVHGVHRTYPCNMCDKVYDRCKTLTEHQRRTHMKVLKHRCEYCDQRFYLPCRLKEHMATHTGEKNIYKCNFCDKSYQRLKTLQDHLKTHSDDRFSCHICGQEFEQNVALKNHIKNVHVECTVMYL